MKKYKVDQVHPEETLNLSHSHKEEEEPEKAGRVKRKTGIAKCCAKVAYRFDNWISQRASQTYALLAVLLVFIVLGGIGLWAADSSGESYPNLGDAIWTSWTFMADPGTHADTSAWEMRVVALLITMIGIVVFSVIMGLVIEAVFAKMESLKKGKSVVVEENHTLMLGWNDECFGFIEEICLANESENGGVIVVLSPGHDKEEMEKQLADRFTKAQLLGTKIVFRTGSPMQAADLEKVAAPDAKSIVIFNEYWAAREPDATILRVILALKGLSDDFNGHIVAEVHSEDNVPLIEMAGDGTVETIVSHAFVGRLMLMAARQPGLATVYHETLGFDGDEFYVKDWPELYGLTFGELMPRFKQAVLMGIKNVEGEILLRPPNDYVYTEGEEIVVIAEDDDTYEAETEPVIIDVGLPPPEYIKAHKPEFILLCGWRRGMCSFLDLLNDMVAPGTKCHMICDTLFEDRKEAEDEAKYKQVTGADGVSWIYENMQLWHYVGNTTSRKLMGALPLHQYTSVMILASQSREEETMRSDSQCVATLLLVHDLRSAKLEDPDYKPTGNDDKGALLRQASKNNLAEGKKNIKESGLSQICELLDPRTQQTISDNKLIQGVGCDFVRSNTMISQVLAMVAEDPGNRLILKELLGPTGASLNIEPSEKYARPGEVAPFWTIAQRVVIKGAILLGYQSKDGSETVMNPHDKDSEVDWDEHDCVVLINPDNDKLGHGKTNTSTKKNLGKRGVSLMFPKTSNILEDDNRKQVIAQANSALKGKKSDLPGQM